MEQSQEWRNSSGVDGTARSKPSQVSFKQKLIEEDTAEESGSDRGNIMQDEIVHRQTL